MATARSVTPAQATSACSSMSPEHSSEPSPPVAGYGQATASSRPVATEHATACSSSSPRARKVTSASRGLPR